MTNYCVECYREQIVKFEAPKVDSGYTAHVSHRPEFDNRHFEQLIEGSLITTDPQGEQLFFFMNIPFVFQNIHFVGDSPFEFQG